MCIKKQIKVLQSMYLQGILLSEQMIIRAPLQSHQRFITPIKNRNAIIITPFSAFPFSKDDLLQDRNRLISL